MLSPHLQVDDPQLIVILLLYSEDVSEDLQYGR